MDSLSEEVRDQILQKQIDALTFELKDTKKQLLQTEDRLETKIRNLLNEHQEEIIHFTEKIKELYEKNGNESVKGVTINDEFKECIDLEGNSSLQSTDDFFENELSPNDTGQNNQIGGGDIESETSNNSNLQSIRPSNQISTTRSTRFLFPTETDRMHTSESFHMYSAATISDPSNTCVKVWLITIISVIITIAQFLILYTLVIEANNPTCVSNQDCRVGEYCDFDTEQNWKGNPRCYDCFYADNYLQIPNITNCSSVLDGYKDMSHTDYADVDHMDIAWKINFDYTDTEKFCFAQLHCNETDLLKDRCDYIVMGRDKVHPIQLVILIFMSFLLAVLISKDIQDALAEERYLNHGLRCGSINPSSQLAAEVLRMALRARQIMLPWFVATAAISIVITDTIGTKNILLNLLTIDVILIADDMLATLFLPLLDQSSVDKLMRSASIHKVKVSMIWSRIHGLLVATILVISVSCIEPLMMMFDGHFYDTGCAGVLGVFDGIILWIPLFAILLHGVGHIVFDHKSATKCKAIMRGIGEMILDLVAGAYFQTFSVYICMVTQSHVTLDTLRLMVFGIILIICFISFKVVKLYTSWQPIQVLNLNLFGR